MKTCFKCNVTKPLEDFYKHPGMTDGRLGKCKECNKKDVRENRTSHREQYAAYEKERFQKSGRKQKVLEYQKRRRAKHPQKNRARAIVGKAIKSGKLTRQPCEVCGELKSEAHHDDYSKPLDVRWLCFKHHREVHGQTVIYSPREAKLV